MLPSTYGHRNVFLGCQEDALGIQQRNMSGGHWTVAYLKAADNVSGPLPIRLPLVNQPVISTPNVFSTLLPSLLADI
jgi:hypothetical protein